MISETIRHEVGRSKYIIHLLLFGISLVIYTNNLSPGVYGGDSGDFLAAISRGGVPHPSGYPLFTMIGVLFSKLPIPATFAWKVGLVSVLISASSVVLMYELIKELYTNRFLAVITSLTLAFTYPFWLYAETVEVFALNSFFIILLLLLSVKFIKTKKVNHIYHLAFICGLSLTNNQSIVLILPAIGIALLASHKISFYITKIPKLIVIFTLGLLPYLYIPISFWKNPTYSWGYADGLNNTLKIIFRVEYGWGLTSEGFGNLSFINLLFQNYLYYWREYVNPLVPILVIIGLIYLITYKKYLYLALFGFSYLLLGPFFIYYSRYPVSSLTKLGSLEKFYLSGILVSLIFLPGSIILARQLILKLNIRKELKKLLSFALYFTISLLPLMSFLANYSRLNFKNTYLGDNFAVDTLNPLPLNSIVMLTADTKVFNALYMQHANNFRTDIYIPGRPDSFRKLIKYSGLSDNDVENYISSRGGTLDKETYSQAIPKILVTKNVFAERKPESVDLKHEEFGDIIFVPWGLVNKLFYAKDFKLSKEEYINEMLNVTSQYQIGEFKNTYPISEFSVAYTEIQISYAGAYYSIADFIAKYYNDPDSAVIFLKKSTDLDPFAVNL